MRLLAHTLSLIVTACLLWAPLDGAAQSPVFFHITTADGLSDNNIGSLAVDKKGYLWIGTFNGVNVFDGYNVTAYQKKQQTEMASDNIIHLTCDSRNRIWLGTPEGVTWVDGTRNFHRVVLEDTVVKYPSRSIIDTRKYGPVLYTILGQYYLDEVTQKWTKLKDMPDQVRYDQFSDAEIFAGDTVIYGTRKGVVMYDYAKGTILYEAPFEKVVSVCRYSAHEIAVALEPGTVIIVDFTTGKISKEFHIKRGLNDKDVSTILIELRPAINGSLLLTTAHFGLVIIDRNDSVSYHLHDPVNASSISSNLSRRVICSPDGDVIVGSTVTGVSCFDIFNRRAGYTTIFNDHQGHFYDSYIADIAQDRDGVLWMGAFEKIIGWDKYRDKTTFYNYNARKAGSGYEIRTVCIDSTNRVWAGTLGNGVSLLDRKTGKFKDIIADTTLGRALKSNIILDLLTAPDGTIWVSSLTGIYNINPVSFKATAFDHHPLLKQLNGQRVNNFTVDRQKRIWMATGAAGVYCYDPHHERLLHFGKEEGFPAARCLTIYEDSRHYIYVGTTAGFTIIYPDGHLRNYSLKDGLKFDVCDGGILEDDNGSVWIANAKSILLFDPAVGILKTFESNMGLSGEGFRQCASVKTKRGELIFGSRRGVNYFYPEQLVLRPRALKVNVTQTVFNDTTYFLNDDSNIRMLYANNKVLFRFNAVNLLGSKNTIYRYKLEGYDDKWQQGMDVREARYSMLPSGDYIFKVEASIDGAQWMPASNPVSLRVVPPYWKQAWFIIFSTVLVSGIIILAIRNRSKRQRRQKEELETEQAIRHFASSISEQQAEEDILWDVVRNCISRLHIEDCVIYIKDEKKNVFVQKAAHGPKRQPGMDARFSKEILPGSGIVGTVGVSGNPEIIRDTTKDNRYIKGVGEGKSEITVPMVYNGTVMGVIDCEHSRKDFFKQKHLSILTTIASLCANKIVRARVEQQKRRTEAILMDTQQKMTEVEMQALRAQMNPHFIFNCLNSINRYIVKSEQATASLYLTKFAKLIRLILDNSNSKNVILTNELEALKLYIEMEALRFDKKFTYEVKVEGQLSTDSVEVPPLIIQPYVENAIWHGLLHKDSNGHLSIRVSMVNESMLKCVIEDNGVGRQRAKELKSKSATSRKSLGMELTESRLSLLNKHAELNASVEIIDMENGHGEASGTKVVLRIPV